MICHRDRKTPSKPFIYLFACGSERMAITPITFYEKTILTPLGFIPY